MIRLHNTLTGRKEVFETLEPQHVRMYVCGVTVYDDCHLGHARSALVFDILRRFFQWQGYRVTYVRNFTDIDDKIIARGQREGLAWQDIVARYLASYDRDMGRLGIRPADIQPKATEHVADIIHLIQRLLERGHAYCQDGDVYFSIESFPAYGRLSKRKQEDLMAGARVEVDERKRSPMDFALWKGVKPGEPSWESPWGQGRPGWHIECSAMSMRHLGETFDLHGGGMDLTFPHHENEIAQSCAASGKEFARYWVHNGFVQVNQEKMSKSLGNFFTIREVFEHSGCSEAVTGEVLRYFLLTTHYRTPLDFSDQSLKEAKRAVDSVYDVFVRLAECGTAKGAADGVAQQACVEVEVAVREALSDDLNTSTALAQLQKLRNEVNKWLATGLSRAVGVQVRETYATIGQVLGLFQLSPQVWEFKEIEFHSQMGPVQSTDSSLSPETVEQLIEDRNRARRNKEFAKADQIRQQLTAMGVTIEDRADGSSRWKH
jgi:cysteinyl-tRNA synthetase